jgi:hypothetical protein
MLINLSNHPLENWAKTQNDAANSKYGEVLDILFPSINPNYEAKEIQELASEYYSKIMLILKNNYKKDQKNAIHIMGELTFVYNLVKQLKSSGITCIASTSHRIVEEKDGKKIVQFNFVKFREY